ncbi:hypothetical protein A3K82_01145 [Candidatus Pacearchaeota archaeon RBG_19FT_COMBO_34_9]|nr:MAG: hypothetical protein A3K82_01145 [Candidatus Pacearchaeota archaeon RBG_19FT_COMBO_34_9]OGJ16505.1 MAG: hypothetical protein A3K74_00125 [Candidatus Pacearchaeota archaeon RBG_13_33_26]
MRNKFYDKRGFLLGSETLKIIIAVICIVFLIFLLFALYYSLTGQEKIKQAEASMTNLISSEIIRINNDGEYNAQGIHIPNPSEWYIFSFVGEEKRPNLCAGKNCVCICEEALFDIFGGNWQIKRCDEKGSCRTISNLKKFDRIKIEKNGINILIEKINNEIEIRKK